jgi:hypothetical protein
MAQQAKTVTSDIKLHNMVKIPAVVIEEQGYAAGSGNKLNIMYGKNYSAVVIVPSNIKLNERMLERINILVNEPLT